MNSKINRKYIFILLISFLIVSCSKDRGKEILTETRIVSLAPHITEIIYALDMDSCLIAVTDFCKYPPEAQHKEHIGGLLNPNIEKIVSLQPTHIFGMPAHSKLNLELAKFDLKILMMTNETVNDIKNIIQTITDTLHISNRGKKLIENIDSGLVHNKIEKFNQKKIKAMLVIGREKGSVKNITVAGPNTYLNEIWELSGGLNIFDDLPAKYSQVNIEEIIKRNPHVIVEFRMNENAGVRQIDLGDEWMYLSTITAVEKNHVFEIGGDYSLIPGPRVIKLAQDFSGILNVMKN